MDKQDIQEDNSELTQSQLSTQLTTQSQLTTQYSIQNSIIPGTPEILQYSSLRFRSDIGSSSQLSSQNQGSQDWRPPTQTLSSENNERLNTRTTILEEDTINNINRISSQQNVQSTDSLSIDPIRIESLVRSFITHFKIQGENQPYYDQIIDEIIATNDTIINLNCHDLCNGYDEQIRCLILFPSDVILIFDHVFTNQRNLKQTEDAIETTVYDTTQLLQTKPYNLPLQNSMRSLGPDHIDSLVSIKGMVIRCGTLVPQLQVAYFECTLCHDSQIVSVHSSYIHEPLTCKHCKQKYTMQLIHNRSSFSDKQIIRIQETPDTIPDGETPHTITVCTYDDMVDAIKPGDRVEITGIYRATAKRCNPRRRTLSSIFRTYIDAIHFKILQCGANRLYKIPEYNIKDICINISKIPNIYDKLTESFAPSIFGMDDVKRGQLCMLFGGTSFYNKESTKLQCRGEINIQLCGDPGTSKSQLQQYLQKVTPRGIHTSGKGSSTVGLTAYITKDPSSHEIVLESGALVLSDKGICCIDEFDKMNDTTRSILHEVMEQQTISIAKAGIVCTLNARASICASANPKQSRYNPKLSVIQNIELSPTLLSRFDLIYLIVDQPDRKRDHKLAQHILSLYMDTDCTVESSATEVSAAEPAPIKSNTPINEPITIEMLSSYVEYTRNTIFPIIPPELTECIVEAYIRQRQRGYGEGKTITATPRQLESQLRISEALAKMKLQSTVTRTEIDEAVRLMNVATQSSATDPKTGLIDMDTLLTGISSSDRKSLDISRERLRSVLQNLLIQRRQETNDSGTVLIKSDILFQQYQQQLKPHEDPLTQEAFSLLLRELETEGIFELRHPRPGIELLACVQV